MQSKPEEQPLVMFPGDDKIEAWVIPQTTGDWIVDIPHNHKDRDAGSIFTCSVKKDGTITGDPHCEQGLKLHNEDVPENKVVFSRKAAMADHPQ
jgi:hypothetical protein